MSAQCSSKKILGVKAGSEQNLVKKKKSWFQFSIEEKSYSWLKWGFPWKKIINNCGESDA